MGATIRHFNRVTVSICAALFYFVMTPVGQANQAAEPDFKIHSGKNDRAKHAYNDEFAKLSAVKGEQFTFA